MAFSDVIADAKEKGFTEPDPRDDLSGTDVARKVTILARACGIEVDLDKVPVTSLVPGTRASRRPQTLAPLQTSPACNSRASRGPVLCVLCRSSGAAGLAAREGRQAGRRLRRGDEGLRRREGRADLGTPPTGPLPFQPFPFGRAPLSFVTVRARKLTGRAPKTWQAADANGNVLRFVGVVDVEKGSVSVELKEYPKTHPFAGTQCDAAAIRMRRLAWEMIGPHTPLPCTPSLSLSRARARARAHTFPRSARSAHGGVHPVAAQVRRQHLRIQHRTVHAAAARHPGPRRWRRRHRRWHLCRPDQGGQVELRRRARQPRHDETRVGYPALSSAPGALDAWRS